MKREKIISKFKELHQSSPRVFRAPGRINLIGEHTDYNDGFVLPAAIDKEIYFAILPNNTGQCNIYADDLEETFSFELDGFSKNNTVQWPNYFMGIVDVLQNDGYKVLGFNCVFGGNIPIGAGVSSSAALESGLIFALNALFDFELDRKQMAIYGQKAENDFVGVNCGIMDQYASLFGEKGKLIKLDCRTLKHKMIDFGLKDYSLVLCDTGIKHNLAESEYNERRLDCEAGVRHIKTAYPRIKKLRDVTPQMLKEQRYSMDNTILKRCLYVVEENLRVEQAAKALQTGYLTGLSQLMYKAHSGLKVKYEVSCDELDFLVETARNIGGVKGARLMGGGFGGCTINIVWNEMIPEFKRLTSKHYKAKFGTEPEYHVNSIVDGVSEC
ncbi:MAG: galactokinase [Bacteroidales bacterium]|nr:galactokinase [Bacteroidales bacterium]